MGEVSRRVAAIGATSIVMISIIGSSAPQASAQVTHPPAPARLASHFAVHCMSAASVSAKPGDVVTVAFRVENLGRSSEVFQEHVEPPAGWTALFAPATFTVAGGGSAIRLVAIQAGTLASAGVGRLHFAVTSVADPANHGHAETDVHIQEVSALELLPLDDATVRVFGNEETELEVRVVNRGNTTASMRFATNVEATIHVTVAPTMLTLPAGGSALVRLRVTADPRMTTTFRGTITLEASAGIEAGGRSVDARVRLRVEAIPRIAADAWLRYPLTVSAFMVADASRSATQVSVQGDGYVDAARRRRLALFARWPNRQGASLLNQRDEMWASLELPRVTVTAGDRAFSVSDLSAQSRYGRGGGMEINPFGGPLVLSGFYVEDRIQVRRRTDWSGSLSLGWGRHRETFRTRAPGELRLHLLHLDWAPYRQEPGYHERIGTIEGHLDASTGLRVEGEMAGSQSSQGAGRVGSAWRLAAIGRVGSSGEYRVRGRRADPDYAGRIVDTADYEAWVTASMKRDVRGTVSIRRYERNLDVRPTRGTANREQLYRGAIHVPLPGRTRASLDYNFYDRHDDARVPAARQLVQHRIELAFSQILGSLSYRAEVRATDTRDRLQGYSQSALTYRLALQYRPSSRVYLSGQARLGRDGSPDDSRLNRDSQDFSGSLTWQPWDRLRLRAEYAQRQERFPDEPLRERQEQEHYSAGIDLRLGRNHELRMDLRRAASRLGQTQTYMSVSYQWRLSAPVARRASVGSLAGRATLQTREGDAPVAHALVRVAGAAAKTDAQGRFRIRTLPQGTHLITVEASGLGATVVPAADHPPTVQIQAGGQRADVRIAFVASATVRGRMEIATLTPVPGLLLPPGGDGHARLGGLLVELSQGDVVRRTLTDARGAFLFQLLPPGSWTMKVYEHGLPALHRLQQATTQLDLNPGDDIQVSAVLVPVGRPIRFVDEGRVDAVIVKGGGR